MATPTRNQIRLAQLTGSLPQSNEGPLAFANHTSFKDTVDTLASSIRRIVAYDDNTLNFFADAQVFKAMGSENKFVVLDNQQLFVSSSTFLSGTTVISTRDTGTLSVTGSNAASFDLGSKLNMTGSGLDLLARTGNINIESKTGTSLIENGTEVFSIDTNRKAKFHQNVGSLASPDVEFDGKVRFDQLVAMSGSSFSFALGSDQTIAKNNSGNLTLSSSVGRINFIDSNAYASSWADKAKGIPLATSAADWSNLQTLGITSILQGLLGASSTQKFSGSIGSPLLANNSTSLNMNLSTLSSQEVEKKLDVFVNGQIQFSGSNSEVLSGLADYRLDYSGGNTDVEVKFSFDLEVDDVIQVVVR